MAPSQLPDRIVIGVDFGTTFSGYRARSLLTATVRTDPISELQKRTVERQQQQMKSVSSRRK
jgi:hypothetical protein